MEPIKMDGTALADDILARLKFKVDEMKTTHGVCPCLAVISAGDDAGDVYIRQKRKACEKVGIRFLHCNMANVHSMMKMTALIDTLNRDDTVYGVIIQYPLANFSHEQWRVLVNRIAYRKDVDGLSRYSVGNLWRGNQGYTGKSFEPCTPSGIMKLLYRYLGDLEGEHAVILGRSELVGKPLAAMLLEENCTVTVCHSKTEKLMHHIARANILVTAMGDPNVITQLPHGLGVLVDVSMNRDADGHLVGDVPKHLYDRFAYYTPVPGGVGPMTVAMLMVNVVDAADRACR